MKLRTQFFQQQLNFLKAIYGICESHYGLLKTLNMHDFPNDKIQQLAGIQYLQGEKQKVLDALQKTIKEMKKLESKEDYKNYNELGFKIGSEIEAKFGAIIDLTCSADKAETHKKAYANLIAKTSKNIHFEEMKKNGSVVTNVTYLITGKDSVFTKAFLDELNEFALQLSADILEQYRIGKNSLPPQSMVKLAACHTGIFKHMPQDVMKLIVSYLNPQSLCRLSQTGLFFSRFTTGNHTTLGNEAYNLMRRTTPTIRITIIGDWSTGKKTLIHRLTKKLFNEGPLADKDVIETHLHHDKNGHFLMQYTYVSLTEQFKELNNLPMNHYKGDRTFLICFDLTSEDSFKNVKHRLDKLREFNLTTKVLLVGTKCDAPHREVNTKLAQQYAFSERMVYFETSAKTGYGLKELEEEITNINKASPKAKASNNESNHTLSITYK